MIRSSEIPDLEIGNKIKLPSKQSIGPCNADRSNAVVMARMMKQDFLWVTNVRLDAKRGIIISAAALKVDRQSSDYLLEDIEKY